MVFRLPSNLETLIPPLSEQHPPASSPWRGSFLVSGMRSSDQNDTIEIFVTAVETDGEKYVDDLTNKIANLISTHPSRAEHWPSTFYVRVAHEQPVLQSVQAWIAECVPPLPICTFMPNRLRETNANTVNQANFRSLSRILFENQAVAFAPWGTNIFPGAGMIIYPAQNSSAILVGALFFFNAFPAFVNGALSPNLPASSHVMPSSSGSHYRIVAVPHFGTSQEHQQRPSLSPHNSDPSINLATYPNINQGSSSAEATWSNVKAEEETGYTTYPPTHENPPYP